MANKLVQNITEILLKSKDRLDISSIVDSKSSVVVRFSSYQSRQEKIPFLKQELQNLQIQDKKIYQSSIPVSYVSDGQETVKIVYKYDVRSSEGLAFEHILNYTLNNQTMTDKFKDKIKDLKEDKQKEYLERSADVKQFLENKFKSNIVKSTPVGGIGSKTDLLLELRNMKSKRIQRVGISLKSSTTSKENCFFCNKDLGDGTEENSLIPCPTKNPWWHYGRNKFKNILKEEFNPSLYTNDFPSHWNSLKKTKEYKDTVKELYSEIRQTLVNSLRNMTLDELCSFVQEMHLGKQESEHKLYKLSVTTKDIKIHEIKKQEIDYRKIYQNKLQIEDIVRLVGAKIIIDIPGLQKTVINSVKFRSNLLASEKSNLRIKIR